MAATRFHLVRGTKHVQWLGLAGLLTFVVAMARGRIFAFTHYSASDYGCADYRIFVGPRRSETLREMCSLERF